VASSQLIVGEPTFLARSFPFLVIAGPKFEMFVGLIKIVQQQCSHSKAGTYREIKESWPFLILPTLDSGSRS
jgi:hypothetical protein